MNELTNNANSRVASRLKNTGIVILSFCSAEKLKKKIIVTNYCFQYKRFLENTEMINDEKRLQKYT